MLAYCFFLIKTHALELKAMCYYFLNVQRLNRNCRDFSHSILWVLICFSLMAVKCLPSACQVTTSASLTLLISIANSCWEFSLNIYKYVMDGNCNGLKTLFTPVRSLYREILYLHFVGCNVCLFIVVYNKKLQCTKTTVIWIILLIVVRHANWFTALDVRGEHKSRCEGRDLLG